MDGGDEMIHGLSEEEKFKVIRPMLGEHMLGDYGMPIIHKTDEEMLDIENMEPVGIKNLTTKQDNSKKIVLPFTYDKDLLKYWTDPMKYIPRFQTVMAVGTPDYSIYPTMNINEVRHNVYMNRWLGCLWQTYKCVVLPVISWWAEDTYDICFSGIEKNSIVIVSTIGLHSPTFRPHAHLIIKIKNLSNCVYGKNLIFLNERMCYNMGSRGAFQDVDTGKFNFVENGQNYHTVGDVDGVQVILQNSGAVKAPEYSHSAERAYAIVQNGKLKHLSFYDETHRQIISIDLLHQHHGLMPHKHLNLDHSDKGIPITADEEKLIKKIKRRFGLS